MGLSEKAQVEGGLESDSRKWVIAGIALRAPLKPIYTTTTVPVVENSKEQKEEEQVVEEAEAEAEAETEECSTTPTSVESRIPTTLTCPPPPRKRRPSSKCSYRGVVRELFTQVPDLETVFMRHVEKAS